METLLTSAFISALIYGAVVAAMPLLLAGMGELLAQTSGVLNIGLEGMVLIGAYCGFLGAVSFDSIWIGFICGALGGAVIGMLVAALCVRLGLNQIIIGIAVTMTVQGLTALLHYFQFSGTYPRLPAAEKWPAPVLNELPVLGASLFDQQPLVYLSVLLCLALGLTLRHTFFGLNLTAAGDKPAALDAAGVDVFKTRFVATSITGLLGGVGGAFMAEVGAGTFVPFMTNGTGYIAIVLAMLARGRPLWVLWGALLFGISLSTTTALQVAGVNVPTDVIQMLPFAMVLLVLVIFGRKASPPETLGIPYARGQR